MTELATKAAEEPREFPYSLPDEKYAGAYILRSRAISATCVRAMALKKNPKHPNMDITVVSPLDAPTQLEAFQIVKEKLLALGTGTQSREGEWCATNLDFNTKFGEKYVDDLGHTGYRIERWQGNPYLVLSDSGKGFYKRTDDDCATYGNSVTKSQLLAADLKFGRYELMEDSEATIANPGTRDLWLLMVFNSEVLESEWIRLSEPGVTIATPKGTIAVQSPVLATVTPMQSQETMSLEQAINVIRQAGGVVTFGPQDQTTNVIPIRVPVTPVQALEASLDEGEIPGRSNVDWKGITGYLVEFDAIVAGRKPYADIETPAGHDPHKFVMAMRNVISMPDAKSKGGVNPYKGKLSTRVLGRTVRISSK